MYLAHSTGFLKAETQYRLEDRSSTGRDDSPARPARRRRGALTMPWSQPPRTGGDRRS